MKLLHAYGFAILVGLAWTASAILSLQLRDGAGAVLLMWPSSGVAVAGLFVARGRMFRQVLGALALGNLAAAGWYGLTPFATFGYCLANLSETIVVVALARRLVGRRRLDALRLRHMLGLIGSALAGSFVGASMALPFRGDQTLVQFAWWILSAALGTSVCATVLLVLHRRYFRRRIAGAPRLKRGTAQFSAWLLALFLLDWWVLSFAAFSLAPLVIAGLVFAVSRYGQLGASAGVAIFGVAGTLQSLGGQSPAAYLPFAPIEAGLVLQAHMLLMLATSLPLAGLIVARDRLALRLEVHNARMRDSLELLALAEDVARIGRWRYHPATGKQDWSDQMFRINGLDPALGRDPGNIRAMLPDGGVELFGELAHHSHDRARYSFEYRIRTPGGEDRILKMHATNEFSETGEPACMFGVVMDVTEHHQRQEALDRERTRAMRLAADAQYLAQTDPLTGLANRRRAITQLEKCIRQREASGKPLALIVFDIDHFKQVNDRFGHQTGDDVLVRVADIARAQVRASDLVGRIGGEEFVWLLPGAGETVARQAALRLRLAIERESGFERLPTVTASIGYAVWQDGDDANSLLARADAALYAAKGAGRNQVRRAA